MSGQALLGNLAVIGLAVAIGFELISGVPSLLHTPLMSATNAIHGVILVGAMIAVGVSGDTLTKVLGTIAVAFGNCQRRRRIRGHQSAARHVPPLGPRQEGPLSVQPAITVAYIVAALLFVVGIRRMRSPETAPIGNVTSAIGMLIAVVATFFNAQITDYLWIVVGMFAGTVVGYISAERVAMTAMPQMVAAFNGVGGGAAALIALSEFHRVHDLSHGPRPFVFTSAILFSALVGAVSFAGSAVAFAKLQGIWPARLAAFPGQAAVNLLVFLGALALGILVLAGTLGTVAVAIVLGLGALLGILLVMPIGGADMPIVISLLNAFTGLAAAASGFALSNYVLIIAGSLVGASGTILTQLMSSSLGRSLPKILFGALAGGGGRAGDGQEGEDRPVRTASAEDVASVLTADADSIILVPGYGLAVAQAQKALSGRWRRSNLKARRSASPSIRSQAECPAT